MIDFLSVGFLTRDLIENREQPGGSAFYTAATAQNLGLKAGIWTSAEKNFASHRRFSDFAMALSPSEKTTTFRHRYDKATGKRTHRIEAVASPLDKGVLPLDWKDASIVMLCPNGAEVSPKEIALFKDCPTVGLMPQGWFRRFEADGSVRFTGSMHESLPRRFDLIVVSRDDIANAPGAWEWLKSNARVAVRTLGREGHIVAEEGREREFKPPFIAEDIDPTGAGDVFGAAMLIAMKDGASVHDAAQFGSAAASYAVEKEGVDGIPDRGQIGTRLTEGRVK